MASSLRPCLAAACLALAGCASGGDCKVRHADSPQFRNCLFANPPNPQTLPGASA